MDVAPWCYKWTNGLDGSPGGVRYRAPYGVNNGFFIKNNGCSVKNDIWSKQWIFGQNNGFLVLLRQARVCQPGLLIILIACPRHFTNTRHFTNNTRQQSTNFD